MARIISWTPEQIRKRVATQKRLRAEGKFAELMGAMPVFPVGHDESGLRYHVSLKSDFEDFVSSPAYQKNIRKIKKAAEKEKVWTKSNSIHYTPKVEPIVDALTPEI